MAPAPRPRMVTRPFVLVCTAALAYFTSYAMLIPTLPAYVEGPLSGGDVAVGIAVGGFAFSALLLRPWVGILGDRRGRRLLIVSGAFLVTLSVGLMVPAASIVPVVVLRLVAGAGEALFFVGSVAAISDMSPPERRGEAVSLFSVSLYLGIAIGPTLGETINDAWGFDAVWYASAGLCVAAFVIGMMLRETLPASAAPPPKMSLRRILHPAGLFPGLVMLTSVYGFAGYMAFMPLYVDDIGLGGSKGVLVMYGSILVAIRLFGARLPDLMGFERAGLTGLSLSTIGLALMGTWRSVTGLFAGTAIFAVGQALSFPVFMALAATNAPPEERGAAVGTTTAFIDLGFGVGPVTLGAVAAAFGDQRTFLVSAAVAACGIGIQLVARGRRRALPQPA